MRLAEERGCNCSFEVKPVDGLPAARQQNRWADTCWACSALSLHETMGCAACHGWEDGNYIKSGVCKAVAA